MYLSIFLQAGAATSSWTTPVMMGGMILVFYFFMIRPQAKKAKDQKKLTIFVGAGVSMNSGVPSWGELIKILKNGIELDDDENDYLKIPQLYYNQRGEKEYYDTVFLYL